MIGEWSRKISNQICENQNEKEIIQYGLNQLFWILLNFFAIAISGVLWHEFCFSILVFLEIYFLRPYAGGYHADTEIKCCMISVGIVNIAMLVRKIKVISLDCMFVIYLCFLYFHFPANADIPTIKTVYIIESLKTIIRRAILITSKKLYPKINCLDLFA